MANIQHIYIGTTAPTTAPTGIGHHYINTIAMVSYISVGAGSVSDWVLNNDPALLNLHLANLANPHGVTKTQVGLGSADNTSDLNKPVSVAQQSALNLKADLFSPSLSGVPTSTTPPPGDNTTKIATTAFVVASGSAVVDATTTVKGIVKLAGDLSGTADLPTVPSLSLKEDASNKATDLTAPNNVKYPSTLAVSNAQALDLKIASNLSDLNNAATSRANLGVDTTANISASTDKNFVTNSQVVQLGKTTLGNIQALVNKLNSF